MGNGTQASGQGEFRGDFTRDTFDAAKRFSRVLMQQGRVQLDSDWNEQNSILLHYLRSLAADLIGPHGGPDDGFRIASVADGSGKPTPAFKVTQGHYYVEGILCETDDIVLDGRSGVPFPGSARLEKGQSYLIILDVWECHVTCNEDGDICEVALGGPDTATRAQVMCQIDVPTLDPKRQKELQGLVANLNTGSADSKAKAQKLLREFGESRSSERPSLSNASLRARARVAQKPDTACGISPESQFRGAENQLYRVEIHKGGPADGAAFKWSRDNGSVIFPILTLEGDSVKLATLGRDVRRSLKAGDWVEIVDDDLALQGQAGPLRQISAIQTDEGIVTLSGSVTQKYDTSSATHPLLRRWDQSRSDNEPADNAMLVKEGDGEDESNWIALEDGVEIQFLAPAAGNPNTYRAGDYWLIPARVAIGDVWWPKDGNNLAKPLPPHGVWHDSAPLAVITLDDNGNITPALDLRRTFVPFAQ